MHLVKLGDTYFMLSKAANSQEIADALRSSFEKLKADGTYAKILKKYSDLYGISQW